MNAQMDGRMAVNANTSITLRLPLLPVIFVAIEEALNYESA